jgi:hypothetical protein
MLFDRHDAGSLRGDPGCVRDLRAIALRCGASLGWEPAEVASFAAKLADRAWDELGADDLLRVIDEYWLLMLAVAARHQRPIAPRRAGGRRAVRA